MTIEIDYDVIKLRGDGSLRPGDLWNLTAASLEFPLVEHEINGAACRGRIFHSEHPYWKRYLTSQCSGCGLEVRTKSLTEGPWTPFENSLPIERPED
ncbi:MAG: hypothetical protein UV71_C0003G0001 [Microgenomates group bacterium GW2011_GWC1_43_13]|uniref:Uncharacterized protein n=3 Tax=Candidatus Woeseibacteriota TaxID=1752722 RepID=A0A837IAY7_9BACT|nr:MAG: hypothetical protein UV71_C0003G0001 [Microgenomates group bacterium GW2011_GWC1_43_13]KKT32699.1 MAG: hypothetical protein UW20_C0010G0001 [Candidatus Woesebacteria bacterium GW2011_GWB1_44_11]KKT53759.1 MAG: hypothetical protein UW47_C0018G0001 [Candidatus Woesebacteria bacterium GW2011_GWA1_44_23]OGM76152.1 MAG: hypothetical protein A2208_00150 [Candidatus Woesebacteria bacterium RIFOXYA1_FULL_43_16]OGM81803.1 MAG: hypothetical protein A2394_02550 [Candidatus Woesebacteria bacterium 